MIEKHFTLSRAEGGVDSAFSLEPTELRSLVTETQRSRQSLGQACYGATQAEIKSQVFRRPIGQQPTFHRENWLQKLIFELLGLDGAPPYLYEHLLGKTTRRLTGQEHLEPGPAVVTLVPEIIFELTIKYESYYCIVVLYVTFYCFKL